MSRTLLALFAVTAAAGPADDALRAANAAARGGNPALAETLYGRCEERTADPGLVAFNRAAAAFDAGDFREAELNFLRCLDDRDIPADRRLSALYNRGVCLLHRGEDAKLLRVAVGCFEPCVEAADPALAKDARHNLELAKLLWAKARARQKEQPLPNDTPEPDPPVTRPVELPPDDPITEPGAAAGPNRTPQPGQTQPSPGTDPTPTPTKQQTPGAGTQPVLRGDAAEMQRLSPTDTQALLDKTDARLRQSRLKNEQMRAGPERPNVRDW